MSIQVIVDINDISSYVTSVERRQSICDPIGEAIIGLSPNVPTRINTFEDVLIYENGIKVFTGYTTSVVKARMPIKATLTCSDVLIKAKQTWIKDDYISNGESVAYWMRKFIKLSGITKRSIGKGQNYQVYPGFGWGRTTAFEAMIQTLQMCPFQIYTKRDGTVTLTRLSKSNPVKTVNAYINYERTRNDGWIRNRAVVMGYDDIAADITWPNIYLPNEVRTVTVATGSIYTHALADQIAQELLYEFSEPLDVKVVTIPGDPELEVGQAIHLIDSWSGFDSNCVIVSLASLYEKETYQVELSLDERCPKFWGWNSPPTTTVPQDIWAGCGSYEGVWRSPNGGINWDSKGLDGKKIYDLKVNPFTVVYNSPSPCETLDLWAATSGGLYRTTTSGAAWQLVTLPEPEPGLGAPTVASVVPSKTVGWGVVYVLAYHTVPVERTWIYKTEDFGATWIWLSLVYPSAAREEPDPPFNRLVGHKFAIFDDKLYGIAEHAVPFGWVAEPYQRNNATEAWTCIGGWGDMAGDQVNAICADDNYLWATGYKWAGGAENVVRRWNPLAGWATVDSRPPDISGHDIVVRDSGNIAVLFEGNLVREYHPITGAIVDQYAGTGWHLKEFDTILFKASPPPNVGWEGLIRRKTPGGWWTEWHEIDLRNPASITPAVTGGPGDAGDERMWACVENWDQLLNRNNAARYWPIDLLVCPEETMCVWPYADQLYIGGQSKIYRRSDDAYTEFAHLYISGHASDRVIRIFDYQGTGFCLVISFTNGALYSGIWHFSKPLSLSDNGRTHLLDVDIDDDYLYIATIRPVSGKPLIMRVSTDLKEIKVIFNLGGGGTWGGVKCDDYLSNRVWVFGNFGINGKANYSDNQGIAWTTVADPAWSSLIRPLLPGFGSILAVENGGVAHLWKSPDTGVTWADQGAVDTANFTAQCGVRDPLYAASAFLGRLASGAHNIIYTPNEGLGWLIRNGGFPADAPVTSLLITS